MNELKEAYRKISVEDKRNELNKEVLALLLLTNEEEYLYNYPKNSNMSEDDFLTETYIQIMALKNSIIELLINKK